MKLPKLKLILVYGLITLWVILWVNFIARDLFKGKKINDYMVLVRSNAEEKHAYVYGDKFFELLKFAKKNLPDGAKYRFLGIKEFSLKSRRGIYYMYPFLESNTPDYILAYNGKTQVPGFRMFKKLKNDRFILKRY